MFLVTSLQSYHTISRSAKMTPKNIENTKNEDDHKNKEGPQKWVWLKNENDPKNEEDKK